MRTKTKRRILQDLFFTTRNNYFHELDVVHMKSEVRNALKQGWQSGYRWAEEHLLGMLDIEVEEDLK